MSANRISNAGVIDVSNRNFVVGHCEWTPYLFRVEDGLTGVELDGLSIFTGRWGGPVTVTIEFAEDDSLQVDDHWQWVVHRPYRPAASDLAVCSIIANTGYAVDGLTAEGARSVLVAAMGRDTDRDQVAHNDAERYLIRFLPQPATESRILKADDSVGLGFTTPRPRGNIDGVSK
ncbi:MAG: hypothetical protein K2X36_03055 [Microbacteriaceae bacterium]|nr:hypothetical protein [Microbacteriaceae bacterium]